MDDQAVEIFCPGRIVYCIINLNYSFIIRRKINLGFTTFSEIVAIQWQITQPQIFLLSIRC